MASKKSTAVAPKILILHGPNLNMLGTREPQIYGSETLDDINKALKKSGSDCGMQVETLQSNAEYVLIDRVQAARTDGTRYIIINPAAFTHTSVALRDAFAAVSIPFIEVHLSNIHKREPFRHHSYFSDLAVGTIVGLGSRGYMLALAHAIDKIQADDRK